MPKGLRMGAGTNRYKIEQLETLLQEKRKQVAKLEKRRQILAEREQMVALCIEQQGDMLHALGHLMFTLPEDSDEAFECKATAAVEALLKDMEVAQLMHAADSYSRIGSAATALSDGTTTEQQQQQQPELGQQPQPQRQEQLTAKVLRKFLSSPDYLNKLRWLQSASVEDIAGSLRTKHMELGFAVATYPWKTYNEAAVTPAAAAALKQDSSVTQGTLAPGSAAATNGSTAAAMRLSRAPAAMQEDVPQGPAAVEDSNANTSTTVCSFSNKTAPPGLTVVKCQRAHQRLQDAAELISLEVLLLHIVHDKVLKLSLVNMDTMEPEVPGASFWEYVASQISITPEQMSKLHTGFVWYNCKRTELTCQMQQTMQQLQQLLGAPLQQSGAAGAVSSCEALVGRFGSRGSCSANEAWPAAATGNGRAAAAAAAFATPSVGDFSDYTTLERMDDADRLLQQLGRQVWQLREVSRCLIFLFVNTLDPLQLSVASVHAWPYVMQPPPIVEALVKWELQRQQQQQEQEQQLREQQLREQQLREQQLREQQQAASDEEDLGQV